MKRIILSITCLLIGIAAVSAQNFSEGRFSMSLHLGESVLFGHSNLSAHGIHFRKEHKHGFSADLRAFYDVKDFGLIGLKLNGFLSAANHEQGGTSIAEDLTIFYIAPQIGDRCRLTKKIHLEYALGAGHMYYQSKSFIGDNENEFLGNKGFLGANADLSFSYNINKHFSIGAGVSLVGGSTSSLKAEYKNEKKDHTLDKQDKIKMARADFALSVKRVF
jgi:hypothetical protein